MGALLNSTRGVWSLTEIGRSLTAEDALGVQAEYHRRRRDSEISTSDELVTEADPIEFREGAWKSELLRNSCFRSTPEAFERLTRRLLREAGFSSVEVTGRGGDGGIDETGLYSPSSPSLISFPVVFQCKRYQGSVGSSVIRDLRGAMSGRGERGMLRYSGSLTRDAQAEATRDGVAVVELVDGDRLCELLKELGLGTGIEIIERVSVVPEFFMEI